MSAGFAVRAHDAVNDSALRSTIGHATTTIRQRREEAVGALPDWPALRSAAKEIKDYALHTLDEQLELFEQRVVEAGGAVHWAADAESARATVTSLVVATGARDVLKVKSMLCDEIGLNDELLAAGITPWETDLAEMIVQLAGDSPSHILVPAIHHNRAEIRELFARELDMPDLGDEPADLAEAARIHLRDKMMSLEVAICGVNFAVAETGTICLVESEGNGRMSTTLPRTLIAVVGIEKVVARLDDLSVMLQVLAPSATGEFMNPYTSLWTGVHDGDGPAEFHVVIVDAGRTEVLADPDGRAALRCIRCSACLNICPVYERTGGHAYESVYPGPIGAVLSPQLAGLRASRDLPWASTLCGACLEVCPVAIDIPGMLVHLRDKVIRDGGGGAIERRAMRALAGTFASQRRYETAQRFGAWAGRHVGDRHLPGWLGAWTATRDVPRPQNETFRAWWKARSKEEK